MALFRKVLSKAIVVDNFHFKNHKKSDKYCQTQTNPTLEWIPVGLDGTEKVELQPLLEGENSESSEQLFRRLGRLRHIVNEMAISRATFYVSPHDSISQPLGSSPTSPLGLPVTHRVAPAPDPCRSTACFGKATSAPSSRRAWTS